MFESYSVISYPLSVDGKKLTNFVLTDITSRANLRPSTEQMVTYKISPGETPEQISFNLYQTPFYHWTILMINSIFDVNSEWFLDDEILLDFARKKYDLSYVVNQQTNINISLDRIFIPNHKLLPTDKIRLYTTGIMPNGLTQDTDYFVTNVNQDSVQLTPVINNTPLAVEFNFSTNTFSTLSIPHGLYQNAKVKLLANNDLPNGFSQETIYFVVVITDQQFMLSTDQVSSNSVTGNVEGSPNQNVNLIQVVLQPIDITSTGIGTLNIYSSQVDSPHCTVDRYGNVMSSVLNQKINWSNDWEERQIFQSSLNTIIAQQPSRLAYSSPTNKRITRNSNGSLDIEELTTTVNEVDQPEYDTITNFEFESNQNIKKQIINVIKPEYIKQFVDAYNGVISGQ